MLGNIPVMPHKKRSSYTKSIIIDVHNIIWNLISLFLLFVFHKGYIILPGKVAITKHYL